MPYLKEFLVFLLGGITMISIACASLLLFGKTLITKLTEQSVELLFTSRKTKASEAVKSVYSQLLERFKTDLQKEVAHEVALMARDNIGYQIASTEYIKRRFEKLEALQGKAFIIYSLLISLRYNPSKSYQEVVKELSAPIDEFISYFVASLLYTEEECIASVMEYQSHCSKIIDILRDLYKKYDEQKKVDKGQDDKLKQINKEIIALRAEFDKKKEELNSKFFDVSAQIIKQLSIPEPKYSSLSKGGIQALQEVAQNLDVSKG